VRGGGGGSKRNEAYKLTGCIYIGFTADSNTILNNWLSGMVENLEIFLIFLIFKCHIPLCNQSTHLQNTLSHNSTIDFDGAVV
jgi:hypothetical protein